MNVKVERLLRRITESEPERHARRKAREAEEIAAFERTPEGIKVNAWLRAFKHAPEPEWVSRPSCPHLECPAGRLDVLLGEARLTVARCVHDGCIETAVRPIGQPYACEIHTSRSEGN